MSDRKGASGGLPAGWKTVRFGDVLERVSIPIQTVPNDLYREIGIRSHGKGIFHKGPVKGSTLGSKRVFSVVPGCLTVNIVFAWEGAVAVTSENEAGMIASHRFPMFRAREGGGVDVEFLRRFFQTALGVKLLGDASPGGAGRNRTLNQAFLEKLPIPLPPLPQQQKIAAILRAVDRVIDANDTVLEQLKIVKKAIMAELLTRGLPARHARFKMTEAGEVPETWDLVPLGDLIVSGPDNGIYKPQTAYGEGAPIVRIDSFENGDELSHENLRRVRLDEAETRRFRLVPLDLVINRVNSLTHIGKVGIVSQSCAVDVVFESNMMRVRVDERRIKARMAFLQLQSDRARRYFERRAKRAVAQASINQDDVRAFTLLVPPQSEQEPIIAAFDALVARERVESRLSVALRATKTALVSALLAGEIRVPPATSDEAAA